MELMVQENNAAITKMATVLTTYMKRVLLNIPTVIMDVVVVRNVVIQNLRQLVHLSLQLQHHQEKNTSLVGTTQAIVLIILLKHVLRATVQVMLAVELWKNVAFHQIQLNQTNQNQRYHREIKHVELTQMVSALIIFIQNALRHICTLTLDAVQEKNVVIQNQNPLQQHHAQQTCQFHLGLWLVVQEVRVEIPQLTLMLKLLVVRQHQLKHIRGRF